MTFTGPFQSGGRISLPRLAASLGFFCWQNEQGVWHIQPRTMANSVTPTTVPPTTADPNQTPPVKPTTVPPASREASSTVRSLPWTLQQQPEDRWLLSVKGVPQISMQVQEAIAFLNRQKESLQNPQN